MSVSELLNRQSLLSVFASAHFGKKLTGVFPTKYFPLTVSSEGELATKTPVLQRFMRKGRTIPDISLPHQGACRKRRVFTRPG
jgi:hypothetical protein